MKTRFVFQLTACGLIVLVMISVITAIAAANTIPATRLDSQIRLVTANDIKPSSCIALNLQNIISGAGTITGTNGNDLILGSASDDTIDGLAGTDCILSGNGNDTMSGGDENDVCNGGGNPGDVFATCETIIP